MFAGVNLWGRSLVQPTGHQLHCYNTDKVHGYIPVTGDSGHLPDTCSQHQMVTTLCIYSHTITRASGSYQKQWSLAWHPLFLILVLLLTSPILFFQSLCFMGDNIGSREMCCIKTLLTLDCPMWGSNSRPFAYQHDALDHTATKPSCLYEIIFTLSFIMRTSGCYKEGTLYRLWSILQIMSICLLL